MSFGVSTWAEPNGVRTTPFTPKLGSSTSSTWAVPGRIDERLAIFRKAHGSDHDDVATALNNLAYILHRKGDLASAEPLFREALAIYRRKLGEEHPDVATGAGNLGRVLQGKGDLAGAESLFRQALAVRRRALGEDHSDVAYSMYDLAVVRLDAGDPEEAERLLRDALAIQDRRLPPRDSERGRVLAALGRCLLETGRRGDAEPPLREGLSILADKQPGHLLRFEAASLAGAALAGRGALAEAESLMVRGYEGLAGAPSAPPLRRAQARNRIVAFGPAAGPHTPGGSV